MMFDLCARKSSVESMEDSVTNLKFWRLTNNLKQSDAARLCGLGVSAYSLIESGRLLPSPEQHSKLERVFGAKTSDMLLRVSTVQQ